MHYRLFFCLLSVISFTKNIPAQTPRANGDTTIYKWFSPGRADTPVIEGQAWPREVQHPYDRLPARAEALVRKDVWGLSLQSAGLMVRFMSNAPEIRVRYTISGSQAMLHMPATGVSGVDLYASGPAGGWYWCGGQYSFKDTIGYRYIGLAPAPSDSRQKVNDPPSITRTSRSSSTAKTAPASSKREYRLYLPLYTTVNYLEIGVPEGSSFQALPVRADKPIVVYGTSIAQGACASRPGMAWTAILGRRLDCPVINLGFSGNGRLEKEVIDLLTEIDARLFVLDCLPNMIATVGLSPEEVMTRIIAAVRALRQRSKAPVLLVQHAGYTDGEINPIRKKLYTDVNQCMDQAFRQLQSEGIKQVYLLSKAAINLGNDMMVDGTHPSDLGMQRYADAYEKCIRAIGSSSR